MLGGYLKIFAVVIAIGFIALGWQALTEKNSLGKLLRALSMALIAFVAYIIPALNPVKNPFFGSEFQILLVLGTILVMHMLLAPKDPKRPTGFGVFLLVGMTAVGLAVWQFPPALNAEMTANSNRVVHYVEQAILDNAPANANVFVTSAGRVNSSSLYYLMQQEGRPINSTDIHRLVDLNLYKQQFETADIVVAAEPGVDEFENWLPSYKILDQTLQLIRDSADFHQVGSVASQSGKRFFIFARQPTFGGWTSSTNLAPAEGPFPKQGLPVVHWGLHPGVSLQVSTATAGRYRLVLEAMAPIAGQELAVKLDGHDVGHHAFGIPGPFERVEIPLDLSAGEHEIVLGFSAFKPADANDSRSLGLLFKRLQIIPASASGAGK
jgi:hypothetical protein